VMSGLFGNLALAQECRGDMEQRNGSACGAKRYVFPVRRLFYRGFMVCSANQSDPLAISLVQRVSFQGSVIKRGPGAETYEVWAYCRVG
jgi:hypothetical protein